MNCEGKRILSANFFSGKRSRAENHAPREEFSWRRKKIERHQCCAPRGAKTRAAEAARQKIRDANRGRRIHATRSGKAHERRRIADERRARERLREIPRVTQAEVQALPGDRMKVDVHVSYTPKVSASTENGHSSKQTPRRSPVRIKVFTVIGVLLSSSFTNHSTGRFSIVS